MPTYRNETSITKTYGTATFKPGEDVAVSFFVPYGELGLALVSDVPHVKSRVLFSGTVTNETILIPRADRISITIVTPSSATLYLADDATGIYITAATGFRAIEQWKDIGKITVSGTAVLLIGRA